MRLSTSMLFERGMTGVQRQLSEQVALQEKIASGKRLLKPSDDPVAAAAAINIEQAKGINKQYSTNSANAEAALVLEEAALGDATRVLQDIKTLTVKAGNASLQNADRASLAIEMQALYDQLMGVANRTDGKGTYLFSGYQGATQPFIESAPGVVTYAGDEGQRLVQIGAQRRIAVGDSGADVFQRVREGNGTFVTTPNAANAGTGVVGAGTLRDPAAWANPANSRDYDVVFHVGSGVLPVTTYDIVDNVNNVSMLTGLPPAAGPHARTYTSGAEIVLSRQAGDPSAAPFDAGIAIDLTGAPATGDTFAIGRSQNRDVFATVHDLIVTLQTPITDLPTSRATFQNRLNLGAASIDRAMDSVLTAQSATGSRMREVDAVRVTTEDLNVNYEADLSRLQSLDYAQALSDLTRKQVGLEAAQKSYLAVTQLSLFDLL